MTPTVILCPGGDKSQTGTAVRLRYPDAHIEKCGDNVNEVSLHLSAGGKGPYVVPIWNSHQGEIKAAEFVWDRIQKAEIKISDIWPKRIEFWFVRRTGGSTSYRKIGSVIVAKTQCSRFLDEQGAELVECGLTTVAFDKYRAGALWDGVLVADGQGENEPGYQVISKRTANPNNFTSFVNFVPAAGLVLDQGAVNSSLTGVSMRSFGPSLGDIEQSFFEQMLEGADDLKEVPKLIFVLKRTAKVGLIFEGTRFRAADLLDIEELEQGEVAVYEDAGATAKLYTEELHDLFVGEFPDLNQDDFILHCGKNTCLFACPKLGLYTHGYEIATVEPVVRFYVNKLFQRLDQGMKCTTPQAVFFERHKASWREKKSQFIEFKIIGPTGS